ncbi:MAG: hypothetical protein WC792_00095 [Candidatus Micrarchaeia archaeon]|jgi:hypothetical protein
MKKTNLRNRRGMLFSIDAIFALAICVMLIGLVFGTLSSARRDAEAGLQVSRVSSDFLSVLEKTGALSRMASAEIINATSIAPPNVCLGDFRVKKYPAGNTVFSVSRLQSCNCPSRVVSSRRTFVVVNASDSTQSNHIAELKSCTRSR